MDKYNNNINNTNPKKKNIFITILKILTFPLHLIFLIIKYIFKLIVKIFSFVFKLFLRLITFISTHIKGTIISCIIISIILIIVFNIYSFFKYYNKVFLTNKEFNNSSEYVITLDKRISKISGKINTLSPIDSTKIKIYCGNLKIIDTVIEKKKSWSVNISHLVDGMNTIELLVLFKDGNSISQTFYLYNNCMDNLNDLDTNDTDKDGLLNYQEDIFGTNMSLKDTDSDGLSDYSEVYYTFTNPTLKDTDNNNINDGDEDFDKDGLNNIQEVQYKTDIFNSDSDEDGLSDYDEINIYGTNPNSLDTDNDGIADGLEVQFGLNPKSVDSNISVSKPSDDSNASVILQGVNGQQLSSITINKSSNSLINSNYEAYISGPYNFSIDGNINNAQISFSFDNHSLKENAIPTIYYFDSHSQTLEELPTTVSDNVASCTVQHFSEYVLLDKNIVKNKLNNAPKLDGSNVPRSSLSTDEYIVISFPIFNIFGAPIYVLKVTDKNEDLNMFETILEKSLNDTFDLQCGTIPKLNAKFLDAIFSWLAHDSANSFGLTEERETYENIFQYLFFYRHIYGSGDLEKYITGENGNSLPNDNFIDNTELDTNKDGISDYFTKLICNGQLTTKLGTNPFGGVEYSEIQKSKDFDGDKLKNGEEIEIINENGKYYIIEHSSPILSDSDGDSVDDKNDASPLDKFDERFSTVNSLRDTPATPIEDDFEAKSNSIYNTEKGDCGSILTRANIMVSTFGKMPAALALGHFLDNTGSTYDFNNDWGLLNTYRGKENLAKNTNDLMTVAEQTVKINSSLYFATNTELTGTDYSKHLEDLADVGWWYAVGHTRATMVSKVTNIDNTNYKMTLYYNIVDFYDWNGDADLLSGFAGLVNDAEMYRLHTYGIARQYRINIPYKMEINWKRGDRYYLNKLYLYDTPETMIINKLN